MSGLAPETARRIEEAARAFGARIQRRVPMARCTSAGVGGPVDFLLAPTDPGRLEGLQILELEYSNSEGDNIT